METPKIRVLLADDHTIVRKGVAQILDEQRDMRVVAQAADGISALAAYRRERPDVALLDLRMPELEGVSLVEKLREEFPAAVLVVLTTYDTEDDIDRALRAGARGYLLKDVAPADLESAASRATDSIVHARDGSRCSERTDRDVVPIRIAK